MLDVNVILELNENIVIKGINTKFWALDTEKGSQYRLNELSYDILASIDGRKNVGKIIELQQNKYAVASEVLSQDIDSFLCNAIEKGIVKEVK